MNNKKYHTPVWVAVFALAVLCSPAGAQMRPECGADPTKPGACFDERDAPTAASIGCGPKGLFIWFGINGDNDFNRENPDGTRFVHNSAQEVEPAVFCTVEAITSGLCFFGAPLEPLFVGNVSIEANGVLSASGQAQCPFIVTGSGEMTRESDGKTIQVRPRLHLVPDNQNGGCKLQSCEILKPGKQANGS